MNLSKLFLIAPVLFLPTFAQCAPKPVKLSKESALKAIVLFRQDPQSDLGRGAAAYMFDFVEKSPDVLVKISKKVVPFLGDKSIPQEAESLLLAAFAVGNADSQLLRNNKKDDPYSGVLQVIETYRRLQKRDPKLRVPQVDKFIDLERRGELKQYVSTP